MSESLYNICLAGGKKHSSFLNTGFFLLFAGLLIMLLASCTEEKVIKESVFEADSMGTFVEPGFPFITTTLDARQLGTGFPENNVAPRCLAMKLGNHAFACFDMDLLRWSVAWTGDFITMTTMAQTSYRDFHNKDNKIPEILGKPQLATGLYPGWSGENPAFDDPRPPAPGRKGLAWGPLPREIGRWNGVYLKGEDVVLNYTVRGSQVYEMPGSIRHQGETAFTRTFRISGLKESLSLVAAEVPTGSRSEVHGRKAFIYHGENDSLVTAIGLADGDEGISLDISADGHAIVRLQPDDGKKNMTLVMWKGTSEQTGHFDQLLTEASTANEIPEIRDGGPARWPQVVYTQGRVVPDTAAYVMDKLTLPIPNHWDRNVRAVDIDFFEDGRAAIVTFDGDIWMVEGIDDSLHRLRWRRYASGLYEPQSIEIVEDTIYTYGREGIVRFHDLNQDGEADYYENFSNLMVQSLESRQWPSDMVTIPSGGFYVSQFGALDMGPDTGAPKVAEGFRIGNRHSGTVLEISPDGQSARQFATGFRGPYLGIHPENGTLSASDQQGNFVPSTPIMLIQKDGYFGVPATAHRRQIPEITPPLLWIPHQVDRSGMQQVWMTGDEMGPLNGQMIHLSYGRPGLFNVVIDTAEKTLQGGISVIPGNYTAPVMKGTVNPRDGLPYLTGFSLWGSNTEKLSSLFRLRYTGMQSPLPEAFDVYKEGVLLRFSAPLDSAEVINPGNYQVKRWNYNRTQEYGSGHYKLDGTPGEEILPVFSAHLSNDGRSVFLVIPDMKKVMQMQISYSLSFKNGSSVEDDFWFTVKTLPLYQPVRRQFATLDKEDMSGEEQAVPVISAESEQAVSAERGRKLFLQTGCRGCHSIDGSTKGFYGPSLQNLYGSEQIFEDGTSGVADENYLRESMLYPAKKVVQGYKPEMPSFNGILSEGEINSIILYIKKLSKKESE